MAKWAILGAAALGLAVALPAAAPELRLSPKPVRDEVRAVVAAQLAALKREDFAAARALASAGIRQQFRPEVYELMIRRGYAPLLRHRAAEVGVVSDDGAAFATVTVVVEPAAGPKVRYLYHLFREEGGWRVGGVRPHAPAPKADA